MTPVVLVLGSVTGVVVAVTLDVCTTSTVVGAGAVILKRCICASGCHDRALVVLAATTTTNGAGAAPVRRAAADGCKPEDGGNEYECKREPDRGQEPCVEGSRYAVRLGGALCETDDDSSHAGSKTCGGAHGDDRKACNDPCAARDGAAAGGENTKDQRQTKRNEGNDKADLSPLGDSSEGIHAILQRVRHGAVATSSRDNSLVGRFKLLGRIAGPVKLALGADGGAIAVNAAVVPQVDIVGVGQSQVSSGDVGAHNTADGAFEVGG